MEKIVPSFDTLRSCARVQTPKTGGSGTVIYTAKNSQGTHSTYVLTNEHVVDDSIQFKTRWSPILRRDVKDQVLGTVGVHFFQYRWEQRAVGATGVEADIMAYDKDEDIALLKLRVDNPAEAVAHLFPKGTETNLRPGMSVIAIGAALGEPPIITEGILSRFGREIDNREYWIQTAPTIFGNSGGAVFLKETEQFIGIPAMIAVQMVGFGGSDAITHLSYIVPVTRIYKFLDDQLFRFIYDLSFTEEGEAKAREDKRKSEELKIAAKEELGGKEKGYSQ